MKKKLKYLVAFLAIFHLGLMITGNTHLYKALWYNYVGIYDYQIFDNRTIAKSDEIEPWKISSRYNQVELAPVLQKTLEELNTVSFLVVKNDSILFEEYWEGHDTLSISNSFSMAKTVVGMLIGIAVEEGKIKSLDQKASDFIDFMKTDEKKDITIRHLLTMSSGIDWGEAYSSPFSTTTKGYYGKDLYGLLASLEVKYPPGERFYYSSGDTQILSFILKEATGKTLSAYAREKIWNKIGLENDILWCLDDEDGYEKAYCCINATTRDFARFGKLLLQKGMWNGEQVIPKGYVYEAITPHTLIDKYGQPTDYYGYQTWVYPHAEDSIYYCQGLAGQYIIMVPEKDMVIVRLGHDRGQKNGVFQSDFEVIVKNLIEE